MALITDYWFLDIILSISLFLIFFYYYITRKFNYWKDRNVPYNLPRWKDINLFGKQRKAYAEQIIDLYKEYEGERLFGFFQFAKPGLIIRDPELIERILIKDFSHFEDRGIPMDKEREPLSMSLVSLKGDEWRGLRHKLTPTFSSGKLKGMFEQMSNCGDDLLQFIDKHAQTEEAVDTTRIVTLFSTGVVASCAFGLQFNSESPEGIKFIEMVKKATSGNVLRVTLVWFLPWLATLLGLKTLPADVENYFLGLTKATIQHRQKNNTKREDFFQMLLALKNQDETGKESGLTDDVIEADDIQLQYRTKPITSETSLRLTDELVAAQTFVFLTAGSESVSASISVALHYIASNPEVQSRLQSEVDSVIESHGKWSYQAIKDMSYLEQILQESARLFPIGFIHIRECTKAYKIPNMDLVIEKGTPIFIPTIALHYDSKYHPNPEVFDPDRFEGNNFKPSPMFNPFGDGPRICIAMRFAIVEMKVCIAKIISRYSVKPSPKTITPLRYDPDSMNIKVKGNVWLSFERRQK